MNAAARLVRIRSAEFRDDVVSKRYMSPSEGLRRPVAASAAGRRERLRPSLGC